ncbi:MAG TPA: NAD(P)H-hydrate dehydratase [Xanthobacteraceae bacterium]|nr:NAD(P)H-hydrate dehydratase [Xanthobacteraceae bacterium]
MELLTTAEMAEADRLTIAGGTPGIELMDNAGRAVADAVSAAHSAAVPVTVVAGPGNNGGDGFVAARILKERGYRVRLLLVGDASRLKGDAGVAAGRWHGEVESASPGALAGAGAIVDALFGAGLDRPVEGAARAMIEAMNASAAKIYAVDLPSGINGTSGDVQGLAVRAGETVTFFRRKTGHVLLPGRLHCGLVHIADIGIDASALAAIKPKTFLNAPNLWMHHFPVPRVDGHKYGRGHAVVVSGGISSTGAARLAARGALRGGAGLVTIASPRAALAVNAAASLAVMVRPVDGAEEFRAFMSDPRRNVVVLGPGGGVGPEMQDMVRAALAADCAVVLDADALTSFADEPQALLSAVRAHPDATTVLTPHAGEFSRLFHALPGFSLAGSKLEQARHAAAEAGAIVLLKGPDTVVAAPDGRAAIAENAPPWLATAGSGDVLGGLIAGLLAQGVPGFEAAAAAVWLHGEAGRLAGPGLISEDLPEQFPKLYGELFAAHPR